MSINLDTLKKLIHLNPTHLRHTWVDVSIYNQLCWSDPSSCKSSRQDRWHFSPLLDTRTVCCPHSPPPPPPLWGHYFKADHLNCSSVSIRAVSGYLLFLFCKLLSSHCCGPCGPWLRLGFGYFSHPPCGLCWRAAGWGLDRLGGTLWTGQLCPLLCLPLTDRQRSVGFMQIL